MTTLDWDSLHRFLAGYPLKALLNLAGRPPLLEREMLKVAASQEQRDQMDLEPDSREALDEATADGEMEDRAQQTAGWLRSQHPAQWTAFAKTAVQASSGNLTEADLNRLDGEARHGAESAEEEAEAWREWERNEADRR